MAGTGSVSDSSVSLKGRDPCKGFSHRGFAVAQSGEDRGLEVSVWKQPSSAFEFLEGGFSGAIASLPDSPASGCARTHRYLCE
jgi:hypothetical protein